MADTSVIQPVGREDARELRIERDTGPEVGARGEGAADDASRARQPRERHDAE